jgi:hypothetical protein
MQRLGFQEAMRYEQIDRQPSPPRPKFSDPPRVTLARSNSTFYRKYKASERLGALAILVILLGTAVEVGVLSFLVYLWAGRGSESGGSGATQLWRTIMLRGWAAGAVTLSSVALRIAVDLQAGVCTALVAALILEARHVPISYLGTFSILRAGHGGPWSITQPLISAPRRLLRSLPAVIMIVLYIGTIAAQFLSTILVSSFRDESLLSDTSFQKVASMASNPELAYPHTINALEPRVWSQALTSYPPFAEQPPQNVLRGDNFSDTGVIKRGLIPMTSSVRRYDGAGLTHQSRATCVRPVISGNIQMIKTSISQSQQVFLIGNITWNSSFGNDIVPGLSCPSGQACPTVPLNCSVPWNGTASPIKSILSQIPTSVCLFNQTRARTPPNSAKDFSYMYLVLNTLDDKFQWNGVAPNNSVTPLPGFTSEREWITYTFSNNVKLRASLCLYSVAMRLEQVFYDSRTDTKQPLLNYSTAANSWVMDPIMDLMGIDQTKSHSERGVLDLVSSEPVTSDSLELMYKESQNFLPDVQNATETVDSFVDSMIFNYVFRFLDRTGTGNFSVYFCSQCSLFGNYTSPHPYYVLMFQEIMNRTQNPGLAMQSILFWTAQAQYYAAMPGFDFGSNATVAWAQRVTVPREWYGLGIVMAIIFLNTICVWSVVFLFLQRTEYSFYGNSWHAIAQVLSPETRDILDASTMCKDKEVENGLKRSRMDEFDTGVRLVGSGRVEAAKSGVRSRGQFNLGDG